MRGGPDLLLTFDFPPMGGGIARWMAEMALRYPAGGLIVSTGQIEGSTASDARFPNPVDRLGLPTRRLKTLQGLVLWSRRVGGLVAQHRARFVWCGNLRPAAYPAKWVHERVGISYGVMVHGGDLLALRHNYGESRVKRLTARTLLGSAEVLIANSRWTHDQACLVLRELGLEQHTGRVRVVPLGTDPAAFKPGLDSAPLRAAYDLPAGRWLVTVARLVPHKGMDTTVRALGLLAAGYPDLRYAIVGQGSYQPSLRALAREAGVEERVHFLTEITDAELPLAYSLADIYVGVSRQTSRDVEGFGISLLEASASGKPVVAGRSGGMPDAVRDGETGLLVDPEDPADVARALEALLADAGRRAALGAAGRRAVERFYNWPRVVEALRAISSEASAARP
ncbi:MAG TPA: glycosyltransferase family 4 protein [Gemmatimonadales bacterium]|jgi:phosphatidylinositol alpha-1,6-mannosyltransferase|nr:glycosyltransferase family 4 protein [Gemmatimonadales bacterium]